MTARLERPPTPRQLEALRAIVVSVDERGYPPTHRELLGILGLHSTNRIFELIGALDRRGLVEHTGLNSRGLRVTERGLAVAAGRTPGHFFPVLICESCGAAFVFGRGRCRCGQESVAAE